MNWRLVTAILLTVDPPWLFDLEQDPGEQYDLAAERPDVVAELRGLADEHRRGAEPVEDQLARHRSAAGTY